MSLGIKFQLKLITLTFWTKFAQKGYFWSKMKKVNTITEFCTFELDQLSNLAFKLTILTFWTKLAQKGHF